MHRTFSSSQQPPPCGCRLLSEVAQSMPREEMKALAAVSAQEDQSCLKLIEVQAVSAQARHLGTQGAGCSKSVVQR